MRVKNREWKLIIENESIYIWVIVQESAKPYFLWSGLEPWCFCPMIFAHNSKTDLYFLTKSDKSA